jgi:response regulator RpfG family c-di-GMP phosphodiesterase
MSSSTVLLVEDNPITRKMMRFALEAEGYAVLEAGAGAAALQIAAESRPDLLLRFTCYPTWMACACWRRCGVRPRARFRPSWSPA